MFKIDSFVLYVSDIQASKHFYAELFEIEPLALSPSFVTLDIADNVKVTLKQADTLEPTSSVRGGGAELSLSLPQRGAFNRLYEDWKSKGVHFLQEPKEAIYGMNFVVADLDNHRIRVFVSE